MFEDSNNFKISMYALLIAGETFVYLKIRLVDIGQLINPTLNSLNSFYVLIGISLACSVAPISFEFTVEMLYPIHEGIIGCWLSGTYVEYNC